MDTAQPESNPLAVTAAMRRVRDVVNSMPLQNQLLEDAVKWNAICAGMDSIEDVCGVMEAFSTREPSTDWQPRLLAIYGVLQAMFVQQDATKSLADALGHPFTDKSWSKYRELKDIRELRNRSIGHPSDYKAVPKQARPGGHISRPSISDQGMQIMIVDGKNTNFRTVSIPQLVSIQCREIARILHSMVDATIKSDNDFKAKFKDNRLVQVLDNSCYFWQKIMEAIRTSHAPFGVMHIELLEDVAVKMEAGVAARYGSVDYCDFVKHTLEDFRYALQRLRDFFADKMSDRDALVFGRELESQRKALEESAREIDEMFCHDAEGNPLPWAPSKPEPGATPIFIEVIPSRPANAAESAND